MLFYLQMHARTSSPRRASDTYLTNIHAHRHCFVLSNSALLFFLLFLINIFKFWVRTSVRQRTPSADDRCTAQVWGTISKWVRKRQKKWLRATKFGATGRTGIRNPCSENCFVVQTPQSIIDNASGRVGRDAVVYLDFQISNWLGTFAVSECLRACARCKSLQRKMHNGIDIWTLYIERDRLLECWKYKKIYIYKGKQNVYFADV